MKMTKLAIYMVLALAACIPAFADEESIISIPSSIEAHQGMMLKWDAPGDGIQNLTEVTIAQTNYYEPFGKWNILWDGWVLNLGAAYDANQFNTATLMLGRNFGTIGKYLPIDFPLKDKLQFSVNPIGIYVDDPFDHAHIGGASGISVFKFDVTF